MAQGPSFYYKDIEFWQGKFAKHIKERDAHKRYLAKTQDINCLTRNTNIKTDQDEHVSRKGKKAGTVAESTDKGPSLFNQVLKRRKSRQSVYAPGVIDFDYAGDSAQYQHLIEKRADTAAFPNKSMLNFEMNLRTYKNITEYNASKPFSFPSVKQFSPRK